jgi:hypothetical protein
MHIREVLRQQIPQRGSLNDADEGNHIGGVKLCHPLCGVKYSGVRRGRRATVVAVVRVGDY